MWCKYEMDSILSLSLSVSLSLSHSPLSSLLSFFHHRIAYIKIDVLTWLLEMSTDMKCVRQTNFAYNKRIRLAHLKHKLLFGFDSTCLMRSSQYLCSSMDRFIVYIIIAITFPPVLISFFFVFILYYRRIVCQLFAYWVIRNQKLITS